jgi:PKD repeat protein
MRKMWLLFLGLIVLASCGKKPKSGFIVNKQEVIVGEPVQFTSTATDAYYYHWKFGDGSDSREPNPVHSFDKAGIYDVILHVSNKGGDNWNTSDPTPIQVYGYNSAFTGLWGVTELDSTEHCGYFNHYYTLNIRKGNNESEMLIDNLGDSISEAITGYDVYGNLNKLELNQNYVMSKSGKYYNVSGNLTINGTVLNVYYALTPTSATICGAIKGAGTGIKL